MKRTSFGLTDVGCVRSNNQDSFLIHEVEGLYVVADGMGGHAAGEIASSIAVKAIHDVMMTDDDPETTLADATMAGVEAFAFERIRYAVNRANQLIQHEAAIRPGCRGMGTTVVVAYLDETGIYIAHAGDSRAYLIRPDGIRRLTRDHTWVADQIRAGLITEEQAATSQFRNLLTRSVGLEVRVDIDTICRIVEPGDRYLLCSDGLHGCVNDSEIFRITLNHRPNVACQKLIELARERGGPDNITGIIIEIEDLQRPVPMPSRPSGRTNLAT